MFKKVCVVTGVVVAVVLLSTCGPKMGSLLNPGSMEGTVVLTIAPEGLAARTIMPSLSMEPATYDVYGVGPGGMTFEQLGITPGEFVQASLTPGDWVITVLAYNDEDPPVLIGKGETTVTVVSGRVVSAVIEVYPIEDTGRLDLAVTWPVNVLLGPVVAGELVPLGGGTPIPLAFVNAPDDLSAAYRSPDFEEPGALMSGYYTLSLRLTTEAPDGSGPVHAWGIVEAVRIVAGQVSEKLYELVEDVNHGGVVIDPNMENPIEVTIRGVEDPLIVGDIMTVTAIPSGEDAYLWYLDGAPLTDPVGDPLTGSTITFGSEVGLGFHWLSVVVQSGTVLSSTEVMFEVIQDEEGSSLWGRMVWGFDDWG